MSTASTQLALDCSFTGLSLALRTPSQIFSFTTAVPRSSDILPTELQTLFQSSGTTVHNLTHIFVTVGPGSFTGIRLGLATAEALKLLNPGITIIGLSTLHALALQTVTGASPTTAFSLALDAAGSQVYTQTFDTNGHPQTEAICVPQSEIPANYPLFAPSTLMLAAQPLETLQAEFLLQLAQNPAAHQPPQPVYLKPLTYKKVQ